MRFSTVHLTTGFVWKLGMAQNGNVHSQDFGCFGLFLWHPKSSNRDPNFEPISPDGWWSWSLHHPHAHPAQQRRGARSVADLSWWRHGERLGDAGRHQNPKKTIGQQINNYVQNPKNYRSAFGFFEVFAGTFRLSKTGFPVKLPSLILGNLGDHQVYGNRNKMSQKAPTATSLSLNFRMGTVHEKTPSANIFFEGCIESTWQWPCSVWQEPMEILLNSVRLLVLAGQSHPKCKSQQKSTKNHERVYNTVSQNVMNITAWYVRPTVLYPTMSN